MRLGSLAVRGRSAPNLTLTGGPQLSSHKELARRFGGAPCRLHEQTREGGPLTASAPVGIPKGLLLAVSSSPCSGLLGVCSCVQPGRAPVEGRRVARWGYAGEAKAKISQRELRNHNGAIMRQVDQGETFTVTRNGVPVAGLLPHDASASDRRERFVPVDSISAGIDALPRRGSAVPDRACRTRRRTR